MVTTPVSLFVASFWTQANTVGLKVRLTAIQKVSQVSLYSDIKSDNNNNRLDNKNNKEKYKIE